MKISYWEPQSGVPLLFYFNDLVDGLECPILLFADDAMIYKEIRTPEDAEALKRDMERIEKWSNKWLLTFEPDRRS